MCVYCRMSHMSNDKHVVVTSRKVRPVLPVMHGKSLSHCAWNTLGHHLMYGADTELPTAEINCHPKSSNLSIRRMSYEEII